MKKSKSFNISLAREKLALARDKRAIANTVTDYPEGKKLARAALSRREEDLEVREKIDKLEKKIRDRSVANQILRGAYSKINQSLNKKLKTKQIVRAAPRATVVVNQPVYTEDRSRFFKDTWEEEKRSLFFK